MRRRVIENIPPNHRDRQLKLGAGGLRDVEFAVQLLQLVHGRADVSLRSPTTVHALKALIEGGYVGRRDGAAMEEAYEFLRTLEHRIQLFKLRRSHIVPGRSGGPAAHRPQHGVPAEPGREPHARVAGAPAHRPAAAREALLPTAARGGRVAAHGRSAAHAAGRRAAAHRAGLRRPQGRARAHPGADVGGLPARGDPEVAAARDARVVRRVARSRRRPVGVPQDLRGPRRDALVSPQAPRRGRGRRAARPRAVVEPLRHRPDPAGARLRGAARRRCRAAAARAGAAPHRGRAGHQPAQEPTGRDPRRTPGASPRAVPHRHRRRARAASTSSRSARP